MQAHVCGLTSSNVLYCWSARANYFIENKVIFTKCTISLELGITVWKALFEIWNAQNYVFPFLKWLVSFLLDTSFSFQGTASENTFDQLSANVVSWKETLSFHSVNIILSLAAFPGRTSSDNVLIGDIKQQICCQATISLVISGEYKKVLQLPKLQISKLSIHKFFVNKMMSPVFILENKIVWKSKHCKCKEKFRI